jgi:hypothetical protein
MMKRIIIILLLLGISSLLTASEKEKPPMFSMQPSIRLSGAAGITYQFKVSTDTSSTMDIVNLEIPVRVILDYRFIEWFSLSWSIEAAYGIHLYTAAPTGDTYNYYIHSIFVRVPFMVKFHPLVYKSDRFWNTYLAVGLFFHAWPLNYYQLLADTTTLSGNSYKPTHTEMDPAGIYSPVNIGFRFAIGNQFDIRARGFFGTEVFTNFLFLPVINGWYKDGWNRGYQTVVDFSLTIGVAVSFGGKIRGE